MADGRSDFDRFQFVGKIPPLDDALMTTVNNGDPVAVDRTRAGPRRNELPLGRDVVDFPS